LCTVAYCTVVVELVLNLIQLGLRLIRGVQYMFSQNTQGVGDVHGEALQPETKTALGQAETLVGLEAETTAPCKLLDRN